MKSVTIKDEKVIVEGRKFSYLEENFTTFVFQNKIGGRASNK